MDKNSVSCEHLNLRQTAKFLKQHDRFVILTHTSVDGDALGSAYALYYGLREIGKSAMVLLADDIPPKYGYFATETVTFPTEGAVIVSVDLADKRLMGKYEEEFGDRVDLSIDHHISNTEYAARLLLDANAAAACEVVYELLEQMDVNINDMTAKALYTGLATDTGCFKYANVTAKTHLIAAQLYEYNIDAAEINRLMFDTKSKNLLDLERQVLQTAEYHFDNRCMLLAVTAEMQQQTGCSGTELDGIAVISRSLEGVLAGVTVKQTGEDVFKVSLRTYPPLSAAEICKRLGGGGHVAAAGATVHGTLSQVKESVLNAVAAVMEEADAGSSVN
ncbi:MAG: DHH family phosphoesterase [Clostridia bacterium]|nr:DHH family phosphoesterase [Clostridia bacterium]